MKNIIRTALMILIMNFSLNGRALAVWPPQTSIEQSKNLPNESHTISPAIRPLIERLENDERQLAIVVEQLKQDEKKISELTDMLKKNGHTVPAEEEKK